MTYQYKWPRADRGHGGMYSQNTPWSTEAWIGYQEEAALRYVNLVPANRRHTAIQAGGNIGIFPRVFAKHFKQVATFEPDPENWDCLLANVADCPNVTCVQAALMHRKGSAVMRHNDINCGASFIVPLDVANNIAPPVQGAVANPVQCVDLDQYGFLACDLLQLDVGVCELFALDGAIDTIYKHRPMIVLEINECQTRYGHTKDMVDDWMLEHSYAELKSQQHGSDHVYTYIERKIK